jgi:hypothetical protein
MKSRTLSATAIILLTPLVVLAFQAQADQVRKGELKARSFTAGPLKMTLQTLYGGGHNPIPYITIVVENTSNNFMTFDPRRLTFIDKYNNQIDIGGQYAEVYRPGVSSLVAPVERRIWSKAWIKHSYTLTNKVELPARLYYEDKLLATIIE